MNVRKYIFVIGVIMTALYACNNDDDNDDNGSTTIFEERDLEEQQINEDPLIQEYLRTHSFTLVIDSTNLDFPIVRFDTITDVSVNQTPIWDSEFLETKEVNRDDVDYTLYILNFNGGAPNERQPTFSDSTFVTYRGEQFYENEDEDGDGIPDAADVDVDGDDVADVDTDDDVEITRMDSDSDGIRDIADVDTSSNSGASDSDGDGIIDALDTVDNNDVNRRVFDNGVTPQWFDQVNVIEGWREALVEFRGASNFRMPNTDLNGDGTVSYDMDFGNFTVFMPSGLAYRNAPPLGTGIGTYKALIFSVQIYGSVEADHDNDGVPSFLEDIDSDRIVLDLDDDTDSDLLPNYFDTDDDGDGILTVDEDLEPDTDLTVDSDGDGDPTNDIGNGDPTDDDTDGDGIPNYLDTDDTASRNDS